MGDNIAIDWGAGSNMNPQGPLGVVNQGYAGAEEGYKLGQAAAVRHALNGVDINDPASIDRGVGGLVKAGATDQGNALQNLAWTRYQRSTAPGLLDDITAATRGDQSSQQPPKDPAQIGHLIGTYEMAKKAADTLADTPEEDRAGALDAMKPDLMKRGIPQEAIDSAAQHLSGDGPKDLSNYYGALLSHAQGEGAMPDLHQSSRWSQSLLNNGPLVARINGLKAIGGPDYTGILATAKDLESPYIAKSAEAENAQQIAQESATGSTKVQIAAAPVLATIEAWKAGKIADAQLPAALKKAQVEADIAARHGFSQVPELDASGHPTGSAVTQRTDVALNNPTVTGAGGAPQARTQTPGQKTGQEADANSFIIKHREEANQPAIIADKNASANALAAAHMAQSLNPSNILPWKSNVLNTLNGVGIKIADKDANNLAAYQRAISQSMKESTAVFPRLTGEFHAVQDASATAKTPGDAAALALTMVAAVRAQAAQEKQFRVQYANDHPGEYSEIAFQKALSQQPWANQAAFASPEFRALKFNGKPAVAISPTQFPSGPHKGEVWGVFLPGTPQKTPFRVQ